MDSSSMKRMGVIVIIALLAVFVIGFIALLLIAKVDTWAVVVYSVVYLAILAVLVYEGLQRLKEIDEGLEDAVDNY